MHHKVSTSFIIISLVALLASQQCPAQEQPTLALYAKHATLQQTLLATRAKLTTWQKEQTTARPTVQWSAWHSAEIPNLDAPPPADLVAKGIDGKPLWSQRLEVRDDVVVTLSGVVAKAEVFGRTVKAKEPITLTVGLGGGDLIEVWLNGKKLATRDTHIDLQRYGTGMRMEGDRRNQYLLDLPLIAGENTVLVSVRQSRIPSQFFFTPSPNPVPRVWEQLRKDFPIVRNPLLEDVSANWFENTGWFAAVDPNFERDFLVALFEHQTALANNLRPLLAALDSAKAPANDPRWLELCVRAADADHALTDLARLEKAVDFLDKTYASYKTYGFSDKLQTLRQTALRGEPVRVALDELKHRALVQENPLLKNQKILFTRRYTYDSQHYYDDYYHGPTQWGGNLTELDLATGKTRELVPQLSGGIFDRYDISHDGQSVLFGYRAPKPEGYRLWEQRLDGTSLRQLTFPAADEAERIARHSGYSNAAMQKDPRLYGHWTDDMHPCYLPDGRIVFVSSRSERTVLCGDHALTCTSLYRINADGKNLYELSQGALTESTPTMLDDGRILYTRWEYVYKGIAAIQALWAMRPDGTGTEEVYGNNIDNPGVFLAGRQISGKPDHIVALGCGHEPLAVGSIRLIDRKKDRRLKEAMTSLTPEVETRGLRGLFQLRNGIWREDVFGPFFTDPFPLSDTFFLVSHNLDKRYNDVNGYGIYLLDVFGNRVPIFKDPEMSCFQPMLLAPRPVAPILPAMSVPAKQGESEAKVLLVDLYRSLTNVPPGTVKYLRVMEQIPRSWAASQIKPGDAISGQNPAISLFTHIWIGVLLGVVPVEADGSAFFKVPARRNIYVQALDEKFMEVQGMRTFVNFQPGETRSCIGCHDPRDGSQMPERPLASHKTAVAIRPQPGDAGPRPLHYPTDIQPILDRHCIQCHSGDKPKGNLSLAGTFTTHFSESYENLLRKGLVPFVQEWTGPGANKGGTLYVGNGCMMHSEAVLPYTYGSHKSKLIQTLLKGHQKVKLEQAEFVRLVTWVDANVPFYGSYFGRRNISAKDSPGFRATPTLASARGIPPPSETEPHSVWDSGMLKEAITAPADVCAVTDKTMLLSGSYALRMDASCLPEKLEAFSVSAWVKPKSFDPYNELFRIESSEGRVLFAFQEKGTILSLGLYVNGTYQECDARIKPESVLNGYWHFVAATFDGKEQRVYLDGTLIDQLPHAGTAKIARGLGFVGSAGGYGEFYQGGLDDLRLYTTTLSPEQVTATFKRGAAQLTVLNLATLPAEWKSFLQEQPTFSTTLLTARQTLKQNNRACPPAVRNLFAMNLATRFPEACKNYTRLYNQAPTLFVTLPDLDALKSAMESQLTRLTEYMPLTDAQWARCPADERTHWQALKTWADRMTARIPANEEALGPLLLDAVAADWPVVPERPSVDEPVAPYVVPATPDVRAFTKEEARQVIENDWLFQVDGKPNLTGEIARTRALAARLCMPADALDALAAKAAKTSLTVEKTTDLYLAVRRVKRGLMFRNPVVNFSQLLLVDMPYPAGREWQHETRHRLGYMAVPGGQLLVLKFGNSKVLKLGNPDELMFGEVQVQRLMPQAPLHGSFWRPDLSFDGRRVLFCYKPHNEKAFHIYEINVDGTGLRQITSGIFDDFDPVYLPDGKNFVFSSTRGHTYVRCMPPTNAYMLMRCGLDGENLYFISANNEPDYLPTVMNDGRLIYTRWEYTDKPLWRAQSLWTVNPDGTQPNTFWGNQSVWPDLLKDARSIPGSRRVMFTGSAHHNWFAGCIGIINPDKGANFPNGLTKVTTELTWPESGNGPSDPVESTAYQAYGKVDAYQTPYPLSEKDFLVSARRAGKFILYLMDTDGNRELVYEGVNNIFHAQPLRARVAPPALQDRVNWPTMTDRLEPQGGSIYSANVYHGAPAALQGKAKFLRILHIEQKTYTYWNRRPALSTGPVVSLLQSDGVKRVLGTVPIHPDGSCWFRVPSGVALHFQLLDEQHRALQTMRSFVNIMPGETRGCLGCHEQQMGAARAKAVPRVADVITPVPWAYATHFIVAPVGCKTLTQVMEEGVKAAAQADTQKAAHTARFGTSVSYLKDVQPVLDRYCGTCHQGDGEARKKLDLTLRGYEPYTTLIGRPGWGRTNAVPEKVPGYDLAGTLKVENYSTVDPAAYRTPEPMTRLSYTSKLVELASSGKHHQVKVDPYSLLRLILWVDTMCTYLSDEDVRADEDPQFQGSDWLSIKPRLKTAPTVIRPGPFHANAPGIE